MTTITKEFFHENFITETVLIGKGGFGIVRRIQEKKTKKQFALKTIYCEDSYQLAQGINELVIAVSAADQPAVISPLYYFIEKKNKYIHPDSKNSKNTAHVIACSKIDTLNIITELARCNLYDQILARHSHKCQWKSCHKFKCPQKRYFDKDLLQNNFSNLITGLAKLEEKQIAHRDIKPENILICERGEWKISDFGLSKLQKERRDNLYSGSPNYVSPKLQECFQKNFEMSLQHDVFKSDVFSLGVTFIHAMTLQEVDNLNDPQKGQELIHRIIYQLQKEGYYDDWIIELIAEMSNHNEEHRPNFSQVKKKMEQLLLDSNKKAKPTKKSSSQMQLEGGFTMINDNDSQATEYEQQSRMIQLSQQQQQSEEKKNFCFDNYINSKFSKASVIQEEKKQDILQNQSVYFESSFDTKSLINSMALLANEQCLGVGLDNGKIIISSTDSLQILTECDAHKDKFDRLFNKIVKSNELQEHRGGG